MASFQAGCEQITSADKKTRRPGTLSEFDNQFELDPLNESGDSIQPKQLTEQKVLEELEKLGKNGERMNIFTCKNGQLFFIKLNGEVSSTLEGNDVTIFKFQSDLGETIFLEVGTWIYPLFSELSPCFRSQKGIFIFPDIYSECDGRFVGLILPPEESEALHFVLNELLQSQNDERTKRGLLSTDSVTTGSSYLSAVQGSKYLAGWIDSMADRYVNRLQPQQPTELNPKFVKSMEVANMVTGKAASYMGQISNGLGVAVSAMGRYISSYVPDQAKNIVPDTAVKLAANTVDCLTNVYNGLEESARILDSSLTNSAVKIVEKKYGPMASHVTCDILSTVRNIYAIQRDARLFTPKSLSKAVLRSAGRAVMESRRDSK